MRDIHQRAGTVVLALLIAVTVVAGPMAGSAVAQTDPSDDHVQCGWTISLGDIPLIGGNCEYFDPTLESQSSASYEALSLRNETDDDWDRINNSMSAERTMAYRIAESEFVRAYHNGSTIPESKDAADEAVVDYLATIEKNRLVLRSNRYVMSVAEMDQMDGVSISYQNDAHNFEGTVNRTETLINGSTVPVAYFQQSADSVTGFANHTYYSPDGGATDNVQIGDTAMHPPSGASVGVDTTNMIINFAASGVSDVSLYQGDHWGGWADHHDELRSIRNEVQNEMDTYADNVKEVDLDQIDPSEMISPITEALEFSTAFEETGSTGYAQALASMQGFGINSSTTYQVEFDESSYEGTVFGSESDFPDGVIETNTMYDGANISAWMHVDGTSSTLTLDDDFEVTQIWLPDGTTTDSVELKSLDMQELDPSRPMRTYGEWLDNHESIMATGSTTDGGSIGLAAVAVIVVVVGGLVLLSRR